MESSRIRNIINIYNELKAKGGQFKDVEPCFVEGNEYMNRLWTTAINGTQGSGTENPEDIMIESPVGTTKGMGGDEGTGTEIGADGKPVTVVVGVDDEDKKGKGKGKGEGKGKGKSGDGEGDGGEGDGGDGGKGKGKGKGKDGDGEGGDGEGGEGGDNQGSKGKGEPKRKAFKVGDKVKVKGTGAVGTVSKVNEDGTYEVE